MCSRSVLHCQSAAWQDKAIRYAFIDPCPLIHWLWFVVALIYEWNTVHRGHTSWEGDKLIGWTSLKTAAQASPERRPSASQSPATSSFCSSINSSASTTDHIASLYFTTFCHFAFSLLRSIFRLPWYRQRLCFRSQSSIGKWKLKNSSSDILQSTNDLSHESVHVLACNELH